MQAASQNYKQEMKKRLRDHSYLRATIGVINQEAQASAQIQDTENYTYYSNLKWPLDNYEVNELYAACDQDYTQVDGSMYFLPRNRGDVVLNQGIVTEQLLGAIEIRFPVPYDIRGLTIEFGKAYPLSFSIESDDRALEISEQSGGRFVTDEIFQGATFLRLVPGAMVNGQSRFRIQRITMGVGIYFDSRKILSATKRERVSPVMEDMPTIDFEMVVENSNRAFDIENEESTVNFLEIGQEIQVIYGQELDNGSVEWQPGATVYLRSWSADDEEMSFSATDRFEDMEGTYYRGRYSEEGISLYGLAVDVLTDAGVDERTYWLDSYLKTVKVHNPVPVVSHKEALQLIANAGRCLLYQDRSGNIFMKSSFVPDMTASSDNGTYFCDTASIFDMEERQPYSLSGFNYTDASSSQYFLPRPAENGTYLSTGYVSESVADENGLFEENPTVEIVLEARYRCFGLTLEFGRNHPEEALIHTYLEGALQESYSVSGLQDSAIISHEFPEFDRMVLEFTKGQKHNRVVLESVVFGENTDYVMEYGTELSKTPKGTQLEKVKELAVSRTAYFLGAEEKELVKETIEASGGRHTFYFTNASHGFYASITGAAEGQTVAIVESSSYFVTVELAGVSGAVEVSVRGFEYGVAKGFVKKQLNPTGSQEQWENPLVSDAGHASDLADWLGDYFRADREYDLTYRGEPRIDANDIVFLENKYVSDLLVRVYEHTLKFNGALSGTMKARRDMSYVAAAKNRLAGK